MLKNKSLMIIVHSVGKTSRKKSGCATCRDIFNMPSSVYKGYQPDSNNVPTVGNHIYPSHEKRKSTVRKKNSSKDESPKIIRSR